MEQYEIKSYNEATKSLLQTIKNKHWHTTVNDVKEWVDKDAILQNVETVEGGILYLCITNRVPPDVLEYLVFSGSKDSKKGTFYDIWFHQKNIIIDEDNIVIYATLKNALILEYNLLAGCSKIDNQLIHALYKTYGLEYKHDISHIIKFQPEKNVFENIQQYCKILQIDYSEVQSDLLEIPTNVKDDSIVNSWNPFV
jgi:hypothetical protein